MEQTKSKWTLKNFAGATKKFKWFILGATVVGLVGGFLAFKFLINPSRLTYTSQFTYNINISQDKEKNQFYADGTVYNFTDILTNENVEAVKNSKEEYANANISDMLKTGNLSIKKEINEKEEHLVVTLKGNYFSNDEVAISFVSDLVESQLSIAAKANNNYNLANYLSSFDESKDLLVQIQSMSNQYSTIEGAYTSFFNSYPGLASKEIDGSNTMYSKFNNFKSMFSVGASTKFDSLKSSLFDKSYAYVEESTTKAELIASFEEKGVSSLNSLKSGVLEEENLTKTLESLTSQSVILEQMDETAKSLVSQIKAVRENNNRLIDYLVYVGYDIPANGNVTIDNVDLVTLSTTHGVINVLKGFDDAQFADWKAASASLENILKSNRDLLLDSITVYRSCYSTLMNLYKNSVSFLTPGKVSVSEGFSSVLGGVIGGLALFIISEIVFTAVYIYSVKEKKDGEAQ